MIRDTYGNLHSLRCQFWLRSMVCWCKWMSSLRGSFPSHRGTSKSSIFFWGIFHEINHLATGVPPWLWKPPIITQKHDSALWANIRFYTKGCAAGGLLAMQGENEVFENWFLCQNSLCLQFLVFSRKQSHWTRTCFPTWGYHWDYKVPLQKIRRKLKSKHT